MSWIRILVGAAFALESSLALAFVDAQLLLGARSGRFTNDPLADTLKGTQYTAAVHVDPIPLIPISFGVGMEMAKYEPSLISHGFKSMTSYSLVPQIQIWLSLDSINPYVGLGYAMSGYHMTVPETSTTDTTWRYRAKGLRAAAGVRLDLIPLVSFLAEVDYAKDTLTPVDTQLLSIDVSKKLGKPTYDSMTFSVGIHVGL